MPIYYNRRLIDGNIYIANFQAALLTVLDVDLDQRGVILLSLVGVLGGVERWDDN